MTCVNCGTEVIDKFCPSCGQRSTVKRITFREGWSDFWSRIYGFDSMFPRTMRDLTLRPGTVARKFIDRNRVLYYGPVGYCFLIITLFLVITSFLNVDVREFLLQNQSQVVEFKGTKQEEFNKVIIGFVAENLRIIAFLVIPFNALVARFLFFRKSGFNYLEHTVLPFYLMGHMYWFSIISAIIFKITGSFFLNNLMAPALILYFGFAYNKLMAYQSKWKSFLKGAGVYIIGQLALAAFIGILSATTILLLAWLNPEALEFMRPSGN